MKNSLRLASFFWLFFLILENSYAQNDLCENAIVLTPAVGISWYGNSTTGTFTGATIGSPAPTCAPNSSQDVWYQFVATATLMTVSLQSYNQNYGVQVFENSCSGSIMGCVNMQTNQTDDFASNNFIVGNTYYARVFNSIISNPSDFDFEISILQPPPPANDLCENALIEEPCGGTCAPLYGTFHGATISSPTLNCVPNASQDVWVKFRADHVSNLIIVYPSNSYSTLDLAFEIYEGSCTGPLIACVNNTSPGYTEQYRETNFVIDQTYYIRILNAGNTVSADTYSLTVWYNYFPPNDLSRNAELISPNPSACNTGTFYLTSPSAPPLTCGTTANLDVWYKFVPTNLGMTIFLQPVAGLNHGMQILEGSPTGNTIACVNANSFGSNEIYTYNNYIVGQTYYIRVFNAGSGQNFSFEICITNNSPPMNDLCPNASVLTPSTSLTNTTKGFFNFSTMSTTTPSCGVNASQDVWYQFNATTTTMSVILSQAGLIDIGFQIFQGSCNGLIIGCINSDVNSSQSFNYGELTLNNFVVGQSYFVRVFNASTTPIPSTFHICVLEYATPINDSCNNAIAITPSVTYCGEYATCDMNGATINSLTPSCTTSAMGDVWYQFVATTPITTISLYSYVTDFNLGYELFQSSCSGSSLYCSTNTTDGLLPILTVGQTYYVRVFNTNATLTSYSNFSICVVSNPPPVNNLCTNAINITPNPVCEPVTGTLDGATLSGSISSCVPNANQDLWYKFVAVTPTMTVNLYQSWNTGIEQSIELYESNCNGQAIACGYIGTSSTIQEITYSNFTNGQTYYIRVLATNTNYFAYGFSVCVTYILHPTNDSCENATDLIANAIPTETNGTLNSATITQSFPTCTVNNYASCDVWYAFVANNTTMTVVMPFIENLYAGLAIYQNGCDTNDIGCANYQNIQATGELTLHNYIVGETYYIRVFGESGNLITPSFKVFVTSPSLSLEESSLNNIVLFPNPTRDILNIEIPENQNLEIIRYHISNMLGQSVYNSVLNYQNVDVSALSNGVYQVLLETNQGNWIGKFIKK